MAKWSIEMAYGTNISLEFEADSRDEAISAAKQKVVEQVDIVGGINIETGILKFEELTFVSQEPTRREKE